MFVIEITAVSSKNFNWEKNNRKLILRGMYLLTPFLIAGHTFLGYLIAILLTYSLRKHRIVVSALFRWTDLAPVLLLYGYWYLVVLAGSSIHTDWMWIGLKAMLSGVFISTLYIAITRWKGHPDRQTVRMVDVIGISIYTVLLLTALPAVMYFAIVSVSSGFDPYSMIFLWFAFLFVLSACVGALLAAPFVLMIARVYQTWHTALIASVATCVSYAYVFGWTWVRSGTDMFPFGVAIQFFLTTLAMSILYRMLGAGRLAHS